MKWVWVRIRIWWDKFKAWLDDDDDDNGERGVNAPVYGTGY